MPSQNLIYLFRTEKQIISIELALAFKPSRDLVRFNRGLPPCDQGLS